MRWLQHHLAKSLHPCTSKWDSSHALVSWNCRSFSEDSRFFFTSKCLTWIAAVWSQRKIDQTYQDIIFKDRCKLQNVTNLLQFSQGPDTTHPRRCTFQNRLDLQTKCGDKKSKSHTSTIVRLRDETLHHLGCIWNKLLKPLKTIRYSLISIGAASCPSTRWISWLQMASYLSKLHKTPDTGDRFNRPK